MAKVTSAPPRRRGALSHLELTDLAALLAEQREFRVEQLAELADERTVLNRAVVVADADTAAAAQNHLQVLDALADAATAALADIDAAIRRMADGTYGRCVECRQPIATERLEVLPHCRHCVGCQRAHERPSDRR